MRPLALKLSLAFLAVSLIGVLLLALLAGRIVNAESRDFINSVNRTAVVDSLAQRYAENGGWQAIDNRRGQNGPPRAFDGREITVVDSEGRVVVGAPIQSRDRRITARDVEQAIPIVVDGTEVGRLLLGPQEIGVLATQRTFLNAVNRTLAIAAVGATAASLVLGVVLARTLTQPLKDLTDATRAIARGDLAQTVPVRTNDEFGELATAFNQMGADLAHSQALRRQMTADIAHDLRTPLTIILGHSEALADGVLPAEPETFEIIHDEAKRLNRLIEELRTLSLAEGGELPLVQRPVPALDCLQRAVAAHAPAARQRGIDLQLQASAPLPAIDVDPDRIAQVLDNLLSNALRYTPPNGRVTLSAELRDGMLQFRVADSGPGIAPDDLPHVFDRFYRADKSRTRDAGGSGLGLAIAKSLVEAHGGWISAESDPPHGTTFVVALPLA